MKARRITVRILALLFILALIFPEMTLLVRADDLITGYLSPGEIGDAKPNESSSLSINDPEPVSPVLTLVDEEEVSDESVSPTVYCNTKEETYEAVRRIVRDRVNNMSYYNAKIINPDRTYNNYVYDRLYVKTGLFEPYPILITDFCDFEEERSSMKPYEGDYMYNLFADSINKVWYMEDPNHPDDPDAREYVEHNGEFYSVYEVYLPVITTKEQEDEVDRKVEEILASTSFQNVKDGTNDEKIKVIYDYVRKTIKSATGDRRRPIVHTAYSGLCTSGHQGTCEAYAQVFYRLAREMGVPARVLMGLDANNHTYNLVKRDDGMWWFIDCSSGVYLKSYKEFKHAELQDRFNTVKFRFNYWNNVKDYSDKRTNYTRVFRDGEEILSSIDLSELYELTRADMESHSGAEYVIKLGSDQCLDFDAMDIDFYNDKERVTLDLNGYVLNLRSSGTICLKEIKNGSITIGAAEIYNGGVNGYSGNWRINVDAINNVSITGLLKGEDRCFIEESVSTRVSNVTVSKLHFWARNKLVLYGDLIINACTAADLGDYDIIKDVSGDCRGRVIFKGKNILGRVGNEGEENEDYTFGKKYTPKPMVVRAVNEDGSAARFRQNDVIATNEGTLKYYSNGSAAAAAFDKVYDLVKMNEEVNEGVPEDEQIALKQSGKNLVFGTDAPAVETIFHINTDGLSGYVVDKSVVSLKSDDTAVLNVCRGSMERGIWKISGTALKPADISADFAVLSEDRKSISIDASKASTLGKNVELTLTGDFGTRKLVFNVAQDIGKISVKGFKASGISNEMTVKQAAGTTVSYPIALNRNADTSRLKLISTPEGYAEIVKDTKGAPVLKVDTFADSEDGTALVTEDIRIRFVDVNDTSKQYGSDHVVKLLSPGETKVAAPAVKTEYSSDIDITLAMTLPKALKDHRNLYYRIEAVSAGGSVPEDMKESVTEYAPADKTSCRLALMKDADARQGEGHIHKYNVKVSFVQLKDSRLPETERYEPANQYITGSVKELKNQATRVPAYEAKMKLKGRTASFTAGRKNVYLAAGVFSKNTTYRSIEYAEIKETGINTKDNPEIIAVTEDGSGVELLDTKDMLPGKYTLEAGPEQPDGVKYKPASMSFTVKAPVTSISVIPPGSGISKTGNKAVTMKLSWTCGSRVGDIDYKPADTKLEWSINSDNEELKKAVTVKNGVITVAGNYIVSDIPADNRFTVTAKAVDLGSDSVSGTTQVIEITR